MSGTTLSLQLFKTQFRKTRFHEKFHENDEFMRKHQKWKDCQQERWQMQGSCSFALGPAQLLSQQTSDEKTTTEPDEKKQNFMKNNNFQKMLRTKFVLSWCLVGERTFLHRVRRTAASFFSKSRTEYILMKFKKICVFHQNFELS